MSCEPAAALAAAAAAPGASQRLATDRGKRGDCPRHLPLAARRPDHGTVILPGQFLMIRPAAPGADDPLLGRPLALYDVATDPRAPRPPWMSSISWSVGALPRWPSVGPESGSRSGDRWATVSARRRPVPVLFVAGGIGQTPFLALGRWWLGKMAYGVHGQSGNLPRRRFAGQGSRVLNGDLALRRANRRAAGGVE